MRGDAAGWEALALEYRAERDEARAEVARLAVAKYDEAIAENVPEYEGPLEETLITMLGVLGTYTTSGERGRAYWYAARDLVRKLLSERKERTAMQALIAKVEEAFEYEFPEGVVSEVAKALKEGRSGGCC